MWQLPPGMGAGDSLAPGVGDRGGQNPHRLAFTVAVKAAQFLQGELPGIEEITRREAQAQVVVLPDRDRAAARGENLELVDGVAAVVVLEYELLGALAVKAQGLFQRVRRRARPELTDRVIGIGAEIDIGFVVGLTRGAVCSGSLCRSALAVGLDRITALRAAG